MYKLTLVPFAFFSLVLPILAIPSPVPDGFHGLEKRTAGSVCAFHSHPVRDADLLACRQPCFILAMASVVELMATMTSSSLFPRKYLIMELTAERYGSSWSLNMTRLDALCSKFM